MVPPLNDYRIGTSNDDVCAVIVFIPYLRCQIQFQYCTILAQAKAQRPPRKAVSLNTLGGLA
jgi:hypothetical protein